MLAEVTAARNPGRPAVTGVGPCPAGWLCVASSRLFVSDFLLWVGALRRSAPMGAAGCGLGAGDRGAVGQCSLAPGARAGCGRFGFWGFRWSPCQPEATVSERETTWCCCRVPPSERRSTTKFSASRAIAHTSWK